MRNALLTAALLMWTVPEAVAHHSFAVFFDETKSVTVSGSVTEFRFTNPHAIIEITRKTPQGQVETWRAETNAVTLLRRRGWTADSLKVGETVTIDGWPSRDGSRYLRVRRVVRSDGTVLGAPANQKAD
ncbi:MAG TPA: DUF6152 family protein [Vicinamibacterales bacterium]|nr:DUF6152 family protein [Vicinamibacterales bacterium]